MTIVLIGAVYAGAYYLFEWIDSMSVRWGMVLKAIFVFYCLAGTTLIREVRKVFEAVDRSLEEGRQQVARHVSAV